MAISAAEAIAVCTLRTRNRIVVGIGEQHLQRGCVARGVGIAHDVDRIAPDQVGGSTPSSFLWPSAEMAAGISAELDQSIDGEDADTTPIGQDRETLSRRRFDAAERLGAIEQLLQVGDAQDTRAAERGVTDRVGASKRTSMRGSGLAPCASAAGLHHDDRLHARSGARRRHELARVLDGLDIEQDRAGLA